MRLQNSPNGFSSFNLCCFLQILVHVVHIVVHVILIGVVVEHVITVVVRTVVILVRPGVHDVISHVDITEVAVVVIFVSDKFSSESLLLAEFT